MYAAGSKAVWGEGKRMQHVPDLGRGMGTRRFHLGHLHKVLMKQPNTKRWWKTRQEIPSSAERLADNTIINIYR